MLPCVAGHVGADTAGVLLAEAPQDHDGVSLLVDVGTNAEIVLEGEILPTGWTWPEGRFGEFTRLMGGLHWNPLVRIKAISMRKDAIYYNLHMPWENTWLAAPTWAPASAWTCAISAYRCASSFAPSDAARSISVCSAS